MWAAASGIRYSSSDAVFYDQDLHRDSFPDITQPEPPVSDGSLSFRAKDREEHL